MFAADSESIAESAAREKNLCADFQPPEDARFDWIQFDSREWLKGEIIALYNFVLEFDSDELGLLKIDWDDVRQLRSAERVGLQLENIHDSQGSLIAIGKLVVYENEAQLINGGSTREFTRQRIISIAETGENEYKLWKGEVSLGANIQKGNSDLVGATILFSTYRRTTNSRLSIGYYGDFSRAEGIDLPTTGGSHLILNYTRLRGRSRKSRGQCRLKFTNGKLYSHLLAQTQTGMS